MLSERRATAADMPFLRDRIAAFRLDDERLEPEQFIVFTDPDIVAFGRIKPYGLGVFERFGFRQTDMCPPDVRTKLDRICGKLRVGVVPMLLRRGQ